MTMGEVRLSPKGFQWWRTGHPWVFASDVAQEDGEATAPVRVLGPDGRVLGVASYSPASQIRLRILSRKTEWPGFTELVQERIRTALARRRPLDPVTDAQRLISAEADGLPGLIVDAYGELLVAQITTPLLEARRDLIRRILCEARPLRMLLARNRLPVRAREGLPQEDELLAGERVERCEVQERGLVFEVLPFAGQKTGLFLDQRPARGRVRQRAGERAGDWLDLCSYQGAFALSALAGGAASALAVDVSASALELAQRSAERNGLSGLECQRGDVFSVLEELGRSGRRFDGIIVDPPAFARSRRELSLARKAYGRLNRLAFGLLREGGLAFSCSCSQHMRPELFAQMLGEAAAAAGRRLFDRGRLAPALDHPVLLGFPEGEYLKSHELEDVGVP
ncbi:MAG: hypothetical protein CSA62_04905 [Planctomycetota bacterium]|nr:MAG: hypothetical protein CSA62_04905 [Planctomycetota bacterium]